MAAFSWVFFFFFNVLSRKEFKKMISVSYGIFTLKTARQHTTTTPKPMTRNSITTHHTHTHPLPTWTNKHISRHKKTTNYKNRSCLPNNSSLQGNLRLNVYSKNTFSAGSVRGALPTPPHCNPALLGPSTPEGRVRTLAPLAHLRPSGRKMMSQIFHCFFLILSISLYFKRFSSISSFFSFVKLSTFLQSALIPLKRGTVLLSKCI